MPHSSTPEVSRTNRPVVSPTPHKYDGGGGGSQFAADCSRPVDLQSLGPMSTESEALRSINARIDRWPRAHRRPIAASSADAATADAAAAASRPTQFSYDGGARLHAMKDCSLPPNVCRTHARTHEAASSNQRFMNTRRSKARMQLTTELPVCTFAMYSRLCASVCPHRHCHLELR